MKKRPYKKKNNVVGSIISTYVDFAENTSIHGLKYTVQKETSAFEKILWILIVLLGMAGAGFMLSLFWDRYTSNPTRTSVQTTYAPTIEIPFPALTICNINTFLSSKIDSFIKKLEFDPTYDEAYIRQIFPQILAYTIHYDYNLTDLQVLYNVFDANDYGVQKVMKRVGQTCRDMLVKCKWEAKVIDCKKFAVDTYTPDGICCSFNYKPNDVELLYTLYFGYQMGLTILLDPMVQKEQYSSLHSSGMKVTIHHPRNYPAFGNTEKILAIGRETLLQLEGTRYDLSDAVRDLTPAQRGCVTKDEYILRYFSHYSEENCLTECRVDYVIKNCDCVPFYYGFAGKRVCDITKIPCLADLRDNKTQNPELECDCPQQCEDIFYDVLSTSTNFVRNEYLTSSFLNDVNTTKDSMLLHVYFSSQTQTILLRDTLTSTIYLLSSFGGIFSLFLGCSFISGVEIIYYVCIRFFFNLKVLNKVEIKHDDTRPDKAIKNANILRSNEVLHGNFKSTYDNNYKDENIYTLYGKNVFLN